jgi:hypothetical protein
MRLEAFDHEQGENKTGFGDLGQSILDYAIKRQPFRLALGYPSSYPTQLFTCLAAS